MIYMRLPAMVRDLVENMEDLVFSLDRKKRITYVNRKWREVFGYSEKEIKRLTIEDLLPKDQLEYCRDILERVTQERALKVETVLLTKNGKRIEVEGNVIGKRENGEFKGCLGIFRDVTKGRELERRLKESEERFRVIAEESLLGIFVLKSGKLSYINKIVQAATGYSREELLEIDPFSLIVDEHKPLAIKALEEALKGKKTFVEVKYRTRDGRERWVLMSLTRITLDLEPAILGNWYDITQTKILEEKLRKSEEEYRNLVENALIGVYKTMLSGKIVLANKALLDMLEVSKEEFYSMNAADFYKRKEDREELLRILRRKGRVMGFETELLTRSGKSINVLISAVLEGDFILGTIMDITERKSMENKLIDLTEKMRLLNKILRHDISNDISAILGAIEVYKITREENLLDDAIKAAERSSHLIKEIKELESLISSGELKPVDLNQVIKDIKQNYNIEFRIEGSCKALADDAISSVISNIVRNAIIHGKTHKVDMELRELNGYCEIRIADYGKGIPDEIKEDVFKEGFKYGETGHTGLGLYIAKSVIERYGGKIWIEDNKPKGCVFVIKLKKAQ
jgi:PAS domain S-box-containing protein